MYNILYNRESVAIPQKEGSQPCTTYVEPYEMFGTEYGLFIPSTASAYQFIRWIRRGMKDELPKDACHAHAVHVSNDGEVFTMVIDSEENTISMIPVVSKKFSLLHASRDTGEAFTYLMKDCKTISEAVGIVEHGQVDGMFDPHILLVADWVAHAKEKGYDKIFYHSRFRAD
ncbi:hypothetical protein [Ralstonia phage RP31]|uniref:Uncharacterized protein n=2 Tax=Ripduovirus RP12 TaxID=2560700 RepID=A0A1L7N1L0_9CAUD|nr:hypothetical protein FDH28_gp241 [Ralstonia phage RP12]BAW19154.1 hypothetical protein [Ralstonia phage RP12]BAW19440.1 hypothetical protein [Ralstonia phage RP31]